MLAIDGSNGKILYSWNADAPRHPASLTKLMTLYLLFDALKQGKLTLASQLEFSAHAAGQAPTNLRVKSGQHIRVDDAIRAILVHSANDVAVAIAEKLGGTELRFAQMMTERARTLGMKHTFFHNVSGLPDPLQLTSASDMAILARHIAYDFPQYYHFFATPTFTYQGNHYRTFDQLIGRYQGADGMKTGYTAASGFNLVSSVVRNGRHIIAVIMGGRTGKQRDLEMQGLLDAVFAAAERHPQAIASIHVPWQSASNQLAVAAQPIPLPVPRPAKPNAIAASSSPAESGNWAIQIGAFDDRATARAKLIDYAEKAGAILDDADHIVAPFQGAEGQMLYRARFGPFHQQQARQLCDRLMQHGQTCFAAARTEAASSVQD